MSDDTNTTHAPTHEACGEWEKELRGWEFWLTDNLAAALRDEATKVGTLREDFMVCLLLKAADRIDTLEGQAPTPSPELPSISERLRSAFIRARVIIEAVM